ncbi:MAG TPA: DUF167 domain-containing protein [Planctomycetota bacterium]|nr:DUF167 domain-containing protein [Planctomycetota bacterium]
MLNIEPHAEGVVIAVKVSAGASRDRILGEYAGALKLSVSAAPERGKANKAVCALIAKTLGIPKSAVSVISGETSRDKKLLVRGLDDASVARRRLLPPADSPRRVNQNPTA